MCSMFVWTGALKPACVIEWSDLVRKMLVVLSSWWVNRMKPPQLFSLRGAQTIHLTYFDYCIYYCLFFCINKVILLHFNESFHFTLCDREGTFAGSPVMPSCLLDLSLFLILLWIFCTRLRSGFRGEQISFKAANAPISAITACPSLLLLTAAEMLSSHSLAEILRAVWLLIAEVFPRGRWWIFKKKKSCEDTDFGLLQVRGSVESFEECRRSSCVPVRGSRFWYRTRLCSYFFELLVLLVVVRLNPLVPVSPSIFETFFDQQASVISYTTVNGVQPETQVYGICFSGKKIDKVKCLNTVQ